MKSILLASVTCMLLVACSNSPTKRVPQQITGDIGEKKVAVFSGGMPISDVSEVNVHGASLDGRYVAFFESLIADGSGFPTVTLRIIDNLKNSYVFSSTVTEEGDWDYSNQTSVLRKVAATVVANSQNQLNQYKIVSLKKLPKNKFYQLSIGEDASHQLRGDFVWNKKSYSFAIGGREFPATTPHHKMCEEIKGSKGIPGYTFELNDKVVYADSRVPGSRGCPYNYDGRAFAFASANNILFFIQYTKHGFEGVSKRYVTVPLTAAQLK